MKIRNKMKIRKHNKKHTIRKNNQNKQYANKTIREHNQIHILNFKKNQ